jgi:hypothetical protein
VDEFAWLTQGGIMPRGPLPDLTPFGDRKARLFGCACGRLVWHLLEDTRSRSAVTAFERLADGQATWAEWQGALTGAQEAHLELARRPPAESPADRAAAQAARCATETVSIALPPEGPSFHWAVSLANNTAAAHWAGARAAAYRAGGKPAAADWDAARAMVRRLAACVFGSLSRPLLIDPAWLAWNGGMVRKMADVIYAERRWADLPVLADALEESGCADDTLLGHLRGPGPHALGCHALDALLGKGTPGSAPPGVPPT